MRIERGELVAERDGGTSGRETLRGAQLAGAELQALTSSGASLRHRIAGVTPEGSAGDTFLYRVEQQAADGSWSAWCKPDAAGVSAALPVAAVFDGRGNRRRVEHPLHLRLHERGDREVHPLGLPPLGDARPALGLHPHGARGLLR